MKRIISVLLCICICLSFIPSALGASADCTFEEELAQSLKALGLFRGVSETEFELSRAPTRTEALVMLIRVLGKESDALNKGGKHPFRDVPAWADKYVGYAYENKLTNGVSATAFGGSLNANSQMYLTFVLRALGYSDENGADFTWDNPYTLARQTGILNSNVDSINFKRADVVIVSYLALEAYLKNTTKTLAEKLIEAGAFTAAQYDTYYDLLAFEEQNTTEALNAEAIYKKCSPAVFYIEIYDANGRATKTGSGFFISEDGTAVTNYHVIDGAASAKITLSDSQKVLRVAGVYAYNIKNDWAILKIDGSFPYLETENEVPQGGSDIYAIGSPLGLQNTITQGIVSNPSRTIDGQNCIQISAAISPGSSGGALINKYGKVVGITSSGMVEGQNLNFAIPVSAFSGFSKSRVYPLNAIESTAPSYESDLRGGTERENAFEIMKLFLRDNFNSTVKDDPSYIKEYDDGNIALVYNSEDDALQLCAEYYVGDSIVYTEVDIYPDKTDVGLYLGLYEEIKKKGEYECTADAFATVKPTDISKTKMPAMYPESYYYYLEPQDASAIVSIAHNLYCQTISFADEIFDAMGMYPSYSMASFGFFNY